MEDVLLDAEPFVEILLAHEILIAGAVRGDFDDQAGRPPLCPDLEDPAFSPGDPFHDEDIGYDEPSRVALDVIEQHVRPDVDLGHVPKVLAERLEEIHDLPDVDLGFAHGLTVGFRVVDILPERNRGHRDFPFSNGCGIRSRRSVRTQPVGDASLARTSDRLSPWSKTSGTTTKPATTRATSGCASTPRASWDATRAWCCTAAATPPSRSARRTSSARRRTSSTSRAADGTWRRSRRRGSRPSGSSRPNAWRRCRASPTPRWSTSCARA